MRVKKITTDPCVHQVCYGHCCYILIFEYFLDHRRHNKLSRHPFTVFNLKSL